MFSTVDHAPPQGDSILIVREMEQAAVAFITAPSIREHQAAILRDRLLVVADRHRGRVAASLGQVADLSSAGVNALVAVHARCKNLGNHLALFDIPAPIRAMLRVTRLDRTLLIAATAEEAVRSYAKPRRGLLAALSLTHPHRDAA